MMMKMENCPAGCQCSLAEPDLEKQMQEYANLGSIPHCFFPELCEKRLFLAADADLSGSHLRFFCTSEAFYRHNQAEQGHVHISLAMVLAANPDCRARILFQTLNGLVLDLGEAESKKLLEQARFAIKRLESNEEEIEIAAGEQLIFSTPDPMLPRAFLDFLGESFKGLARSVYAFETTSQGCASNLVIAVRPVENNDRADQMSMIIAQGADEFLDGRDQIDFMVVDENERELIELLESVSPQIVV